MRTPFTTIDTLKEEFAMQSIKTYNFYFNDLLFSVELLKDEAQGTFGYSIVDEEGGQLKAADGFSSEKQASVKAENYISLDRFKE